MEQTIYHSTKWHQTAEELNFTVLLNNCCGEFTNWSCYQGVPKYDEALAAHLQTTGHELHLKFDFTAEHIEIYAPLRYYSATRRHLFHFPVFERNTETDGIRTIDPLRFLELVISEAKLNYPGIDAASIPGRLAQSIANIDTFLDHFEQTGQQLNQPEMTFIEAEQLMASGHNTHALTKGRQGFTQEDLIKYSPETGGQFQLHYFLIHPDLVTEASVAELNPTVVLKNDLLNYTENHAGIRQVINRHPDWKVIPVHPWEAEYLKKQPVIKQMEAEMVIYDLGAWGPDFTATSSVRTVYNAESDWMYKLSLHVKITSAERVNYLHEMHRGYDVARLLETTWGEKLKATYPEIEFITDPAFVSVSYQGEVINGLNTTFRENPFKGAGAKKNVSLLASLCQDGIAGQPARIVNILKEAAIRNDKPLHQIAVEWFDQYLDLILAPAIGLFNEFGLACEIHQQNLLIEFDDYLFPEKLYFRDNQGFLFRAGLKDELTALLPGLAEQGKSFIPEDRLFNIITHYLLISNLFGLINALGCNGLADEHVLLDKIYQKLKEIEPNDTTGLVSYLLSSRNWSEKANLLTSLHHIDGAGAPTQVVRTPYPNLLHLHFFSSKLIHPEGKKTLYSRYFPKENVTISIRPFDLDQDLEMVHEWFHREHAKKIWQMDWPIRQLENYYRTLLPGDVIHSYIGEANGEPSFNFEVYWATRDMLGDYYDVLPTDYGTHQFIAPVDPRKKYASPSTQCMLDWVFSEDKVGKMVGEGSVDSLASIMNKAHVGFKIEKVIELPHKKANLNFCYREWYWAKFPANKAIKISPVAEFSPLTVN